MVTNCLCFHAIISTSQLSWAVNFGKFLRVPKLPATQRLYCKYYTELVEWFGILSTHALHFSSCFEMLDQFLYYTELLFRKSTVVCFLSFYWFAHVWSRFVLQLFCSLTTVGFVCCMYSKHFYRQCHLHTIDFSKNSGDPTSRSKISNPHWLWSARPGGCEHHITPPTNL